MPVQGDKNAMTLGDLVPNEDFVSSSIMFLTPGGATPRVEFGGKQVAQRYVYWTEDDEPEQGAGWYLYADDDGEINQNSLPIPFGTGFLVNRSATEADGNLVYSGAVSTDPTTVEFPVSGYNITGNSSPVDLTLGDITPNEDFVSSSIMFLTPGGATPRVEFGGKQVAQRYVYWTEDDEPEQGAGWYLYADDDGEINQNALVIKAGEGFLVNRSSTEADGTITIPAAL